MKKYLVEIMFEAENEDESEQIVADMLSEIDYDGGNRIEHSIKEVKEKTWIDNSGIEKVIKKLKEKERKN